MVEAPRGVQTWAHAVADVGRGHGGMLQARAAQQGPQARAGRVRQRGQAVAHQHAILAAQRHHVRDGAHHHEIKHLTAQALPVGQALHQGAGQLEGDAHAGQILEGIAAARLTGVEDRHGVRQARGGQVVIGDDDVEPDAARIVDLGGGADAAVDGDDQPDAGSAQPLQRRGVQTIPLGVAVRHVDLAVGAQRGEHLVQQHRPRHAVDVKVAVDGDLLAHGNGRADAAHGLGHVAHQQWRVHGVCVGVQETRQLVRRDTPIVEDLCHDGGEVLERCVVAGRHRRRQDPACLRSLHSPTPSTGCRRSCARTADGC